MPRGRRAAARGTTQFLHFASILATGVVFLGGCSTRWRHLPFAMVAMYAVLAMICFIETVDFGAFGGGTTRFVPMTIEYVTYIGLSTFLLRGRADRDHFVRGLDLHARGATSWLPPRSPSARTP